jgi:hypothetical protein
VAALKITSCGTTWNKIEKNKLKSYILWVKLTTYEEVGHHINLSPKSRHMVILERI